MTTLLLARHGETDWNRDHLWQGHTGPPLNQTGRQQAADLARRITAIDAVYSSDTERAHETAMILAQTHRLRVATDPRLREVNFGKWEGLTRAQINQRYGGAFTKWLSGERSTPTGGEADEAMAERVLAALADISDRHPAGRVLVVTSGGPVRAVEAHLAGVDQATARQSLETVPNCSLIELVVRDGVWSRGTSRSPITASRWGGADDARARDHELGR